MEQAYVVDATLECPDRLRLDEPLPVEVQRVRVTVEPLKEHARQRSYADVLASIHARLAASGHIPPTRAEVDAYVAAERASWTD